MTHSLLAAALLVTTWFHIKLYRSRYLVLASVGLLIALTAFRLTRTLVRCCSLSRDRTITISRISARTFASDLVKVEVELARPWKVTPGQYAHLTLPSLYSNSWLQSHPFMIVAWYDDHGRDTSRPATRLEMIVRPAKGWTEYGLCPLTRPTISRFRTALIDGPYGTGRDLGQYGTVIMVASGMGIFAHIPYIKGLFEGYRQARIRTRRLRIYWQIEYDRCTEWSQKWMNDFLRQDNLGHHEEEASVSA